jgi:MoxR-like ATPase
MHDMNIHACLRSVLLAFIRERPTDKLKEFQSLFRKPDEYVVLLTGYDKKLLRDGQRVVASYDANVQVETLPLLSSASPLSQAAMILEHVERLVRKAGADPASVETWMMLEGLPVGVYEAIRQSFAADVAPLFSLNPPRPFFPAPYARRHEDPFTHQLPDGPVEWQDREFSLDLLDDEERMQLRRSLQSRRSVLLTGDRGTGKTLLARFIHYHSADTARGAFIEANLAAIPETLVEEELQGIAPGTATGVRDRYGLLAEADGGTLFLDEVAAASDNTQAKLLRIVSERIEPIQYRRLGETRPQFTQVRFVSATNLPVRDIEIRLRGDLRARFPIRIHLKPISEKTGDSFVYCLRAVKHFSSMDLAYNPALVPIWDQEALHDAFRQRLLPDNYRDLHSFVTRVWDMRMVVDKPWPTHVGEDEIKAALRSGDPHVAVESQGSFQTIPKSFFAMVRAITGIQEFGDRVSLSEEETKDIVFELKSLVLRIANWYGERNRALARRVYGMRNPESFERLSRNPNMLRPDARRRSGTSR